MKKISINLSSEISDDEKQQAEKCVKAFEKCKKTLLSSKEHLTIMATPFKEHPDITKEEIIKYRAALRRYRDKVVENFNYFKQDAVKAVTLLHFFSSDADINKLMNSFINEVEELQTNVNTFVDNFNDLKANDFVANCSKIIEDIDKNCDQIDETVDKRIIQDIKKDILGKNWLSENTKLETKTPIMIEKSKIISNIKA